MSRSIEQDSSRLEQQELSYASRKLFTEARQVLDLYGEDRGIGLWKHRVKNGSLESNDPSTPTIRVKIRSDVDTKNPDEIRLKLEDRERTLFVKRSNRKGIYAEEEILVEHAGFFRIPADVDTVELYRDVIRIIWPPARHR